MILSLLNGHRIADLWHYRGLLRRHHRRIRRWADNYIQARHDGTFALPAPVILQVIPTEACNLNCLMCIQWGDRGYYHEHRDEVATTPPADLLKLFHATEGLDSLLSIYGGEPFSYPHMDAVLDYLAISGRDVVFSTNGTLLEPFLERLGRLRNAIYMVSVDGDRDMNDRIRGIGVYDRIKRNLVLLAESCRDQGNPKPITFMNACLSEHIRPEEVGRLRKAARDLGMLHLNLELRWFFTAAQGERYAQQLSNEFGLFARDDWRSFCCEPSQFDPGMGAAVANLFDTSRSRLSLPFVSILPPNATKASALQRFQSDADYSFGEKQCRYPSYACRIHANGDMIFCPGLRDLIAGNVYQQPFTEVFNSPVARRLRQFLERDRFAICSRCCGLYLTHDADKVVDGA